MNTKRTTGNRQIDSEHVICFRAKQNSSGVKAATETSLTIRTVWFLVRDQKNNNMLALTVEVPITVGLNIKKKSVK